MRKQIVAAAIAVCIPSFVFAQRGGGGGMVAPGAETVGNSGPSSPRTPTSRDLADLNPATLLIKQKKKAGLADSTVNQLKALEKAINDRNKEFFATYDSTRQWTTSLAGSNSSTQSRELRGGAGDRNLTQQQSSPAEMAKMQSSLRDLRRLMNDYRDRRKTDSADAMKLVPDAQKRAASELVAKQDDDLEKLISTKP